MSLPPLPTTTLGTVIHWVQRMGRVLRHSEKVLRIVWWGGGGGKNRHGSGMVKKMMPDALILPLGALTSRLCSPDGSRGRARPVPRELGALTLHPFGFVQR